MIVDGYTSEEMNTRLIRKALADEKTKCKKYTIYLDNRDVDLNADRIVFDEQNRTIKAYDKEDNLIADFCYVMGYVKN